MKAAFFVAVMLLGFSAHSKPSNRTTNDPFVLLFHWGSEDSNQKMLKSAGQDGLVNEDLFKLLRNWYSFAKQDAGGQGLYVSGDPTDTVMYGNDLVVLEVDPSIISNVKTVQNFKETNDLSLSTQRFDKLPLLVNYKLKWMIIPRVPTEKEGKIRMRPIRMSDAPLIWKSLRLLDPGPKLLQIRRMTLAVLGKSQIDPYSTSSNNIPLMITAPSRDVFLRILTTEGMRFLLNIDLSENPRATYTDGILNPKDFNFAIFESFFLDLMALPVHHSVKTMLISRWTKEALNKERSLGAWGKGLDTLDKSVEIAPNETLKTLFLEMQGQRKFHLGIDVWIKVYLRISAMLSADQQTAALSELARSLNSKDTKFKDPTSAHVKINEVFGPETLIKNLEKLVRASKTYITGMMLKSTTEYYSSITSEIARISPTTLPTVVSLILKVEDEAEKALEKKTDFVGVRPNMDYASYFVDIATAISNINNPDLRLKLSAQINATVSPYHLSFEKYGWGGDNFNSISYNPFSSIDTEDTNILKSAIAFTQFPALAQHYYRYFATKIRIKRESRILWSELAEKALKVIDLNGGQKNVAEALISAFTKNLKEDVISPSQAVASRLRLKSLVFNVGDSYKFSTLSRTLLFVDPLFVSEDLRLNNATQPYLRFDESYIYPDGFRSHQPSWSNFVYAWNFHAIANSLTPSDREDQLETLNEIMLAQNVDGRRTTNILNWNRKVYETVIPGSYWERYITKTSEQKITKFFSIERRNGDYVLTFKNMDELKRIFPEIQRLADEETAVLKKSEESFGGFGTYSGGSSEIQIKEAKVIQKFLLNIKNSISDPIVKASTLLYYFSKLHPFENGNGRTLRLWIAQLLMSAGYDMPVGLPTNEFLINQSRAYWEVRRAIHLGRLWKAAVEKAAQKNLSEAGFFQREFRGSALEGLIHISPLDDLEFSNYVKWLEKQSEPPRWAKEFASKVEELIFDMRNSGRSVAKISEVERAILLNDLWQKFEKPDLIVGSNRCSTSFLR